jgi:protein O-mannosyl-transferase
MAAKSKQAATSSSPKTKASTPQRLVPQASERLFQPGFWGDHWQAIALLLVAAFAVYGVSVGYGYILDDEMVYWKNAFVQKGFGGLREIFSSDSLMGYFQKKEGLFLLEGGRYRPLSLVTFAMEVGLFGNDNPGISHFFNILLYGVTAVLLYRVLLGMFPPQGEQAQWYFSLPFVATALFVLHPLHTECVANIKGRDEILALLGSLAALYAALKYGDTLKMRWLVLSGVFLFLGMLAKENALTFLAIIPLSVWFCQRDIARKDTGRLVIIGLPLLLSALFFLLIRYSALGFMLDHGKAVSDLMNDPFIGMTWSERLATISLSLGWYVKLLFVPHPLTHDYYPYHVPKVNWSDWRAIAGLALHVCAGAWAVLNIRRRSIPAYSILYYLITVSIVSNLIVSVGTFMNERFMFMPSVAVCLLVAWFFTRQLPSLLKVEPDRLYALGALLLVTLVGLYAFRSFTRVPVWKDAMALNRAAVKVSEGSARSHCFFVTSLYKEQYQTTKDPELKKRLVDTMEYHINRSLEINPDYGAALIMKAAVSAARFEQDHQLDKFFHEIEYILEKIPYNTNFRNYLDQYLKYLDGSNSDKYVSFCHRVGYEFFYLKKKDPKAALYFLKFGLDRQTEDIRILDAMAEVYKALGDSVKSDEMKARANAQR